MTNAETLRELVTWLREREKENGDYKLITGKGAGAIFGEWAVAVEGMLKIHKIIREDYVKHGGGDRDEIPGTCYLCDKSWHPQGDEEHAPDCLAAPQEPV